MRENRLYQRFRWLFRYYDALLFLESTLENGRADSMKEALNLYETHLHQERMEVNSRITLEMNMRQCQMLAGIEESMARVERDANIAATFSILNFLSNC